MSMSDLPNVVVTGLGVVSSIGIGRKAYTEGLKEGRSGASVVGSFDTSKFPSHIGGEVQGYDPKEWVSKLTLSELGRSSQMAIGAAKMALIDAGFNLDQSVDERCDVVMGTTDGEAEVFDRFVSSVLHSPDDRPPQLQTAEAISDAVLNELELIGDSAVLATACSAGNYAIGYGFDKIRNGEVSMALCGGSDSQCLKNFGGFLRIGALAPEKCQPFDVNRSGILPAEGAGVLVLESEEHALARGATPLARILGYGASCDGHHIMSPHQDGIETCLRDALKRTNITPDMIDYICAHGTGTTANDVIESAAMRSIYGEDMPPISSIKSMLGHTMGAASALSAIACVLALEHGFMPPTINFSEPDEECAVDCVPNQSRNQNLNIVQNNAFAFGGNNAILMLQRYEESR